MDRILYEYYNHQQVHKEVTAVTSKYPGLKLVRAQGQLPDGSMKELAHLQGTIPVLYKGNTYNIPISIALSPGHPNQPPVCYVKPTSYMAIMQSPMVDESGRIYLKYLQSWKPSCDLATLIKIMRSKFGETPPVTAVRGPVADTHYSPQYPTQTTQPQQSMPPYPVGPYPMDNSGASNPLMPPYPTEGFGYPYPSFPRPQPQANPPYPTSYPYQAQTADQFPSYRPSDPVGAEGGSGNTITEEHIKASLLSAIEDKLKRKLREVFSQNEAEIETLRKTLQELSEGKNRLETIISGLKVEEIELAKNIDLMKKKEEDMDRKISEISDRDVDPDEAIVTTTPLYNQLLNAYAEESTAEDAIYYMGEALRTGVIDLDVFLKQVRALSRKQFTLRALMQKCRQKAGLAC